VQRLRTSLLIVIVGFWTTTAAFAEPDAGGPPPDAGAPADYAKFTKGLTPQRGLFTLWRKDGKLFIELTKDQLDKDFIETEVPASGLGGFGVTVGSPYLQSPSARIVHFSRVDRKIIVTWPNTSFIAPEGSPAARAVAESFAPSIVSTAPIVATDDATGRVILDGSFLLGDLLDLTNAMRQSFGTDKKPQTAYHLDDARTYFGASKAFPDNVIVEADQTFVSAQPPDVVDNMLDARAIGVIVKYNFAAAPPLGTYMPRLADDRVGFFPNIQLDFGNDRARERKLRTISRWNVARHPMVYYIASDVPERYRPAIRAGLLEWNKAFARIGYPDAVEVRDQPDDPAWDPDDIRYNTVHWLTQSNDGGFAEAGLVADPRTGELIHTSIVIDADLASFPYREFTDFTNPSGARHPRFGFAGHEAAYAEGAHENAMFGLAALQATGDASLDHVPDSYIDDFMKSIVLHESGHNWGLEHNFIASEAYSAKDVQSKAFTAQYGLANSVMEYTPTNVWPKGESTGSYFQTVLGPYDYYAIAWGYGTIPGATKPTDELPALQKLASTWSDPAHRFETDEDVSWYDGHAIDPRVDQFDLTNDNIGWCQGQLALSDTLVRSIERRFTEPGESHDSLRQAFRIALSPLEVCSNVAWHYMGGEELSRAHIGDPHASMPLSPVSRDRSKRAYAMLDAHLFGASAFNVSASLMRKMVYSEWETINGVGSWAVDPPLRHDVPIAQIALELQSSTLDSMFAPVLLQRLDDLPTKYGAGSTMTISDLFAWTQASVFGDLGRAKSAPNEIRRNLQQTYARMLAKMLLAPDPGTPFDAQSLARAELASLRSAARKAAALHGNDALTSAHLAALVDVADQALTAKTVLPATPPAAATGSD
jgi:hypothetical protein